MGAHQDEWKSYLAQTFLLLHPLGAPGEVAEDVVTGTMTVMQGTCDGCAFLGFFVILSCQFAKHLFQVSHLPRGIPTLELVLKAHFCFAVSSPAEEEQPSS